MKMTKIKWDENMLIRCIARSNGQYSPIMTAVVNGKSPAVIDKVLPKVKYWDEFKKAIDAGAGK